MFAKTILIALALCVLSASFASAVPGNITQLIRYYGYQCEDYWAPTSDGYLLSLQRIPASRNGVKASKGVVLFTHGLTDNANGVSLNPPNEAMPYLLADAGYDVWLANNRGNGYSMRNTKYTPDDDAFWDFTWDEMAKYDLPANIDFVLSKTGKKSLTYIGHSEGTIQAFAGFSINNALASKVNLFIALAPVTYVYHQKAILLTILSALHSTDIISLVGIKEFPLYALKIITPTLCTITPGICNDVMEQFFGPSGETNISAVPFYMNFEPNPTSTRNIIHWAQGVNQNTFQMYDYGPVDNLLKYGQLDPPLYKLGNIPSSLPIALFVGGNDWLADPADVLQLISQLPVPPVMVHHEPTYAHMDFLWAINANTHIYGPIIKLLQQYAQP